MTQRHLPVKARSQKGPPVCLQIRLERERSGLSQDELARRMEVAQSMVGRWETTTEPRLDTLAEMERVFGLARGEFVRRAGYVGDVISGECWPRQTHG